ncbi:MAG: S-methyl-5-thioribose-1-phosphate isomerase [Gammaproteobacteria bacterium]
MTDDTHNLAIAWQEDHLVLLDQRILPFEIKHIHCRTARETATAITDMVVRGAPAIGISAAYGVVMAAQQRYRESAQEWKARLQEDMQVLADSRPTAVNLFWALARMQKCVDRQQGNPGDALLAEAQAIHAEDIAANRKMGELGASLLSSGSAVLTHCNAGALATGGYGTALGVIRSAFAQQKLTRVYADETRPWLQGARLTAWELLQDHIPVTLVVEGAAASLMQQGKVDWVIVGADRIAANGDVANKIGTYSLAVLARHHGVRFMVAAPTATIDMDIASGADIPIESRAGSEVLSCGKVVVAASGAEAWNPVFDVTPAALVDAIVTERGIVQNPERSKLQQLFPHQRQNE